MSTHRGLVAPAFDGTTRAPYADTAAADDQVYARVGQQAAWVSVVIAAAAGAVDPQAWLFAERARHQRDGACDPWADQMLYRAGLLPTR
ncbi:MAG: hypothetical protein IPK37_15300 [Austwickia sp.]|jgi:hypothetical protein|nr:MAG: hypothetical protein IPK37_15300 [Austwickia sp.]